MLRLSLILLYLCLSTTVAAQPTAQLRLVRRKADPYGSPRPAPNAQHVPVRTSLWIELELNRPAAGDHILPDSVTLSIQPEDGEEQLVLSTGRRFAEDVRGWVRPRGRDKSGWMVYAELSQALQPGTLYTARVRAKTAQGVQLSGKAGSWTFTTEPAIAEQTASMKIDLKDEPVHWRGSFFAGICNVVFCTDDDSFGPLYRMMRQAQKEHPKAWRLQRDIWLTAGDQWKPDWAMLMDPRWPNIVRERETRRITRVEPTAEGVLLHVEDVFGCRQYGVAPGRPLSDDFEPGYEVLIADGVQDVRSKIITVDDRARTVLVESFTAPEQDWQLEYKSPPPDRDSADAPGRFAAGGTFLRRLDPPGEVVYFWDRLDKEYDLAHRVGGRRLVVNFVEAPSDLSLTGRPYTRPKDYVQWHEVVRTITGHLIDRYGEGALDFAWSVFNEPDIVGDYWRFHWDETQRFYDYTVDGVLRAFEDRGYDSDRVRVGGWELGAIFGTHLRLREILAHCSPEAVADGALEENAAFADSRLDGQRSQRVEQLCRAHGGRGSPCDFISIHTYNRSDMAAAKLIRAKEMALEADPTFFRDVWIHTHESCPGWSPPPDPAAADSYLGDGYFPSWCFDVTHRLLARATEDSRFAFGESVVTIWPPAADFSGVNTLARRIHMDEDGDGLSDRVVPVATPVFHALTLLSDFGPDYWVASPQQIGGHALGAFASRDPSGVVRVALIAHHGGDLQSRSEQSFRVSLVLNGFAPSARLAVTEYRFDKEHNSYFTEAVGLRDAAASSVSAEAERLMRVFEQGDESALREAFEEIKQLDRTSLEVLAPVILRRLAQVTDPKLRERAKESLQEVFAASMSAPKGYPEQAVRRIEELARLRPTSERQIRSDIDGRMEITVKLPTNCVSVLVVGSEGRKSGTDGK